MDSTPPSNIVLPFSRKEKEKRNVSFTCDLSNSNAAYVVTGWKHLSHGGKCSNRTRQCVQKLAALTRRLHPKSWTFVAAACATVDHSS
jgi:hypothetical protein